MATHDNYQHTHTLTHSNTLSHADRFFLCIFNSLLLAFASHPYLLYILYFIILIHFFLSFFGGGGPAVIFESSQAVSKRRMKSCREYHRAVERSSSDFNDTYEDKSRDDWPMWRSYDTFTVHLANLCVCAHSCVQIRSCRCPSRSIHICSFVLFMGRTTGKSEFITRPF